MDEQRRACTLPKGLPERWEDSVKRVMLHVVALAQTAVMSARATAARRGRPFSRVAREERLEQEVAKLEEEMRLKDARFARVEPRHRPHFRPVERLHILQLKAIQGWNLAQTAERMLVTPATIASWIKRVDEDGEDGLLAVGEPVNKFPDLVRHTVQRLKTLCPALGKQKIAEALCRAGLHLSASSVGRMLKEKPAAGPDDAARNDESVIETTRTKSKTVVTAKHPNDVWHVDLTVVPTCGFWTTWFPIALPQCFPFCWWVAIVVDHFSRRAMGYAVFLKQPTSQQVRSALGRVIHDNSATPKYIVTDQGVQFACQGYKDWCAGKDIKPRFGALGQHGSIAVAERFIQSMKNERTRRMLVALNRRQLRAQLSSWFSWYNAHRPHMTLHGKTPDEVYHNLPAGNEAPRIEPRAHWPRASTSAKPVAEIDGEPGATFRLEIAFHDRERTLPIVTLRRAA